VPSPTRNLEGRGSICNQAEIYIRREVKRPDVVPEERGIQRPQRLLGLRLLPSLTRLLPTTIPQALLHQFSREFSALAPLFQLDSSKLWTRFSFPQELTPSLISSHTMRRAFIGT
jgi:hypothetical protein